jgi:xylan 1,4-beta-xylosidase
MRQAVCVLAALLIASAASAQDRTDPSLTPIDAHITVDARNIVGDLPPIWRFFGADEPNYATMKDGRKLLDHLGGLRPGDVYFRAHNLLNTGDGTPAFKWGSTNLYTEDKAGHPVYDFTVTDRIIDAYIARGVHPYLQLGFMPQALSSAPAGESYQHSWRPGFAYNLIDGAWNAPPKDYKKWQELAYQWTKHNLARYGAAEMSKWYFEVWNEPNGPDYWTGTPEDFYKLHDYAIAGIRRAFPQARVGGPDVAGSGGGFMDGFLKHVTSGQNQATGQTGTPTDFLSFHAKGSPRFVDDHVEMGIANQLRTADAGFAKIAAVPELKDKPIVIGENDPEGCAACPGPQNAYRNGTLYASYTAAVYPRLWEMAARDHVHLDGALTWAFEFENQPWFAGYRQLSTNGIDLPVMNVFRLFAKLGPQQIAASSDAQIPLAQIEKDGVRAAPDIGVLATKAPDGQVAVLVWHYHDDDVKGPAAHVSLHIDHLPAGAHEAEQWRVDAAHGNAFSAWLNMDSPQSPDEKQYAQLEAASVMTPQSATLSPTGDLDFDLPRQGVTLLLLH